MNRVDEAFQHVDRDAFVLKEDGSQVTQSTANVAIKSSLEWLDIQEGQHVLEIGTGSGYSTALLTYLVGSTGKIISIDIDPDITKRAIQLFKKKGMTIASRDDVMGYLIGYSNQSSLALLSTYK